MIPLGEPVTEAFLARPVLDVARDLLDCTITHAGVTVRITETEAYAGLGDPGSHGFRGPTPRTQVLFGPAGALYVYFTYGMHWCANLVTGLNGVGSAVLLRAGEVVDGTEVARERRGGGQRSIPERDLARGPARLAVALGLTGAQNGIQTLEPGSPVMVRHPQSARQSSASVAAAPDVLTGPRVGVSGPGGDGTAYPWRFWLAGDPTVSPYRAAVPRRRKP